MDTLADILRASNGELTEEALLRTGIGSRRLRRVIEILDANGLTRRVGPRQKRVLAVPLEEALVRMQHMAIPPVPCRKGQRRFVPSIDEMRLLYDPEGLFTPGATFPADQVLPRRWAPDEPGQWAIGTRFERRKPGYPREIYVYDGIKVRRETITDGEER